jgi:glyoxylase-like metal-dependent hydrolase (beta-lactamase superfamily II)/8-oxo-dGTP pyrophosphatase MutT (NUDIX family)
MSELPPGLSRAEPPEPRDSALGIVLRRLADDGWEVLLGKRSRRSRFLPGHLAFPGGGLDPEDEPGRPGALARCASREILEETGIRIEPDRWHDAGERTTPPIFPVRFRTRFLLAEVGDEALVPSEPPSPGEIESLGFARPAEVLADWRGGSIQVPPPVLPVLRVLASGSPRDPDELAAFLLERNAAEHACPRIEFAHEIWLLPVRSPTLSPATHTNVWMPGGERFVIIDPGTDEEGELRRLVEVIRRREGEGPSPAAVVLTHHHVDHVAGAVPLARELELPVWAHEKVIETLDLPASGLVLREIVDEETFDLGGLSLRAVHTPGHAPGHLAFLIPERRMLVAGDLISGLSTILIDPFEGDMGTYLDSLDRAAGLECRTLLPAHGPPLPGKALDRLVEHRRDREARVLAAVGPEPVEIADLAQDAYQDVPETPQALREMQALAHLLHLEERGKVRRGGDGMRRWSLADGG